MKKSLDFIAESDPIMLNKRLILVSILCVNCINSRIPVSKIDGRCKDYLQIQDASVEPIQNIAASIVGRSEAWAYSLRKYGNESNKLNQEADNEFTILGDGGMGTTIVKRIHSRGECVFHVTSFGIEDERDTKETSTWWLRNGNWYVDYHE